MTTNRLPLRVILKHLLIGFAAVVLVAACLYWTIPSNAGLGFIFMAQFFSILIFVLGGIMLAPAFYKGWLPLEISWGIGGWLAWAVVPIFAGPIFALSLTSSLEAYYASPNFDTWYDAWSGITITPQKQDFHFADCSLDGYTATYTITALRQTDLAFALLDRNGVRAVDAADGPARSIGEQFDYVREAHYSVGDEALGIYHVFAGTHTLVVTARSPFQLGILDSHSLWAPDLWLADEKRYYTIYADDYTWEEIVAAMTAVRPTGCPAPCTRLDVPPPVAARERVPSTEGAGLGPVIGETAVDADGDGFYDTLDVAVALRVRTTGDYLLEGSLRAAGVPDPVRARYHSGYPEPLCSGVHTVTLHFDGRGLHDIGANGPYSLTLALTHEEPGVVFPPPVDTAHDVYTTRAYSRWEFAGEQHSPTAAGRVEDFTGNGLYDQLTVDVTFHGLLPGAYRWSGELQGVGGCQAGSVEGEGSLGEGIAAAFVLPGGRIRSSGCNGPYTLTHVVIISNDGARRTEIYDNLHTTPAYRATEFDTTPVVVGRCAHPDQPSRNDNELYDRLAISADVQGLNLPGGAYEWRGSLLGPDGTLIDTAGSAGAPAADESIIFTFSAAAIRRLGIDGPYMLGDVTITSSDAPSTTVTLAALCITEELRAQQFEP